MTERILQTFTEWVGPADQYSAEELRDICCTSVDLDPCAKVGKVSPWAGYSSEPPADLPADPLRRAVIVELVGPDGDCGEKHEEWQGANNCCEGVEPLAKDAETSATIAPINGSFTVAVTGGRTPLLWSVRGVGFFTDRNHRYRDAETTGRGLTVYTQDACGFCSIVVSDGCTATEFFIRATGGAWEYVERCDSSGCHYGGWEGEQQFVVERGYERIVYVTSVGCVDLFFGSGAGECGNLFLDEVEGIVDPEDASEVLCFTIFAGQPLCTAHCLLCVKIKITYTWSCS
ncbi:hypothetical protein [Desulfopila aestuarii]|uniref:Uncharacterized protein n=1 Tax=Desulfopila aestuarii DSM 18488 TaxID=1121416 RepID=A0A1M7YJP7_9BACT|nr:hypothetical protein [Desulfopila aestuarii]SHO52833.1 hypothetical protein SAMN02745220_04792 [Desulfopila aestuarii DSM 18488]